MARTDVTAAEPQGGRLQRAARAVVEYVRAARSELEKVTWPSREELVTATRIVLILALVFGLVIGVADWGLSKILVDGVAALAR